MSSAKFAKRFKDVTHVRWLANYSLYFTQGREYEIQDIFPVDGYLILIDDNGNRRSAFIPPGGVVCTRKNKGMNVIKKIDFLWKRSWYYQNVVFYKEKKKS